MPYQDDSFRRRAPRFEAPDSFYVLRGHERVHAVEISETGMRLVSSEAHPFQQGERYAFKLVMADSRGVSGWEVTANCVWERDGQAGFRFTSDPHLSRDLFARLHRLKAIGKTTIVSGTEF